MNIDIFALIARLNGGKTVLTLAEVIDIARECEFQTFEQMKQNRERTGKEL